MSKVLKKVTWVGSPAVSVHWHSPLVCWRASNCKLMIKNSYLWLQCTGWHQILPFLLFPETSPAVDHFFPAVVYTTGTGFSLNNSAFSLISEIHLSYLVLLHYVQSRTVLPFWDKNWFVVPLWDKTWLQCWMRGVKPCTGHCKHWKPKEQWPIHPRGPFCSVTTSVPPYLPVGELCMLCRMCTNSTQMLCKQARFGSSTATFPQHWLFSLVEIPSSA